MTGARVPAAPAFEVRLPDLGTPGEVTVLEVLVKVGDLVEQEQALLTLESEKATMDVPATTAGKVSRILGAVGRQGGDGHTRARTRSNRPGRRRGRWQGSNARGHGTGVAAAE